MDEKLLRVIHLILMVFFQPYMSIDTRSTIPSAVRLLGIIHTYCNGIDTFFDIRRDFDLERCVAIEVSANLDAIHKNLAVLVDSFEVKPEALTFAGFQVCIPHLLSIPADTARVVSTSILCRCISLGAMIDIPVMGKVYSCPLAVITSGKLCFLHILLYEFPAKIKVLHLALSPCRSSYAGDYPKCYD